MRTKEYFISYGCHLETVEEKFVVSYDEDRLSEKEIMERLESEAYQLAMECTASWVGMHGFDVDEEDEGIESVEQDLIENALDYTVEEWDNEIHCETTDVVEHVMYF